MAMQIKLVVVVVVVVVVTRADQEIPEDVLLIVEVNWCCCLLQYFHVHSNLSLTMLWKNDTLHVRILNELTRPYGYPVFVVRVRIIHRQSYSYSHT